MNQHVLYQWIETVRTHFTNLKKWQAVGLALFSYGVVMAEKSQVGKVAEALAMVGRIPTVERRLRRWLNNDDIEIGRCCAAWIGWVWSACDLPRAVLLVDETDLGNRIGVMMVSLAYRGRAIPLVWRCYGANRAEDYPAQGQVLLIWGLLARVLEVLPLAARPIVEMDRGLAHSSAMLRALQSLQVDYLVRVKATARLTTRQGHTALLSQLVKPGETVRVRGRLFTRDRQVPVHLVLVWEAPQKEAWCLASNTPTLRAPTYALRMWQEESFRDLKSGGWQWQQSELCLPGRAQRLILVLALAYAWMLTQGTLVFLGGPTFWREVCDEKDPKYSLFRAGLRFFKRMLFVHPTRIVVGLFFAPPFKPDP